MNTSEQVFYDEMKGLMNYLKTDVDITPGEVEEKAHGRVVSMKPGYIIKITVSNTATIEQTWPMVVFTGVELVAKPTIGMGTGVQAWMNRNHYKVDISKAPQQERIPSIPESFWETQPLSLQSERFPIMTTDEGKHGYFLFPGQSIIFEYGIIGTNKPNVKNLNFWVQGSLSRRHLFHSMRQVE